MFLLDFSIPEYIISNRIVKIALFITFGIPGTYPRSISIFTCKLATCTLEVLIAVTNLLRTDRPILLLLQLKGKLFVHISRLKNEFNCIIFSYLEEI